MNEEYDVIVLGTGLTECILAGILSAEKKRVLQMDRNDYYGGNTASLHLNQLYRQFRPDVPVPEELGNSRDYNVDLIPKFLMAHGEIVKFLVHTGVTRYLEFKQITGSFVYVDGKITHMPASETEALASPLLGLVEKRRLQKFFEFIQNYKEDDESTHDGVNFDTITTADLYKKFGLEPGTQDLIGHAMALHLDDSYLEQPARSTIDKVILYIGSIARYGKTPYIYPLYGLGELPQSFARLSAIYGGVYMLGRAADEIIYENGVAVGIKSENEIARAKHIICDPSYAKDKVKATGKVVRAICILKHPIPNTNDADSCQIVLPQNQIGRKHDVYVACVSNNHYVAPKDSYLAIVSTIVETDEPEKEVEAGLALLGPIHEKFISVLDIEEPLEDGTQDQVFISRSYDATSHSESVCDDVKDMYRRITGNDLELKQIALKSEDEEQTSEA
ncbi:GDP dissociation inhibitor [Halteromyces radiatus]|uniref:GDP dissociation inhibitor n=1 Tax=Halteromyces radiatus TaxID=101107 RepID=UPI002220EF39|nr:GDP dissociation inhibitor [Halteromyces radiatus]KAI8084902.1 GDP dissociation inhibitor [Halteromyces radiatus]